MSVYNKYLVEATAHIEKECAEIRECASKLVESAPSASSNSRYESAMAVYVEYCEATAPEFKETFDNWLQERLHSPSAPTSEIVEQNAVKSEASRWVERKNIMQLP